MSYTFKHCHYRAEDSDADTLALIKIYKDDELVAVVREPVPEALVSAWERLTGQRPLDSTTEHRVDCRNADADLRASIEQHLPNRTFAYFENPVWEWHDNGTYEEMPWSA